ncbi:MAG: PilW family protein [Burkholderiales bacterium]
MIELLVAMAIGLVLTLAITSVLIRSESSKRSSTSVNDINQSGTYAAYVLDRAIRSAGSGFSQNWGTTYGCLLNVSNSATTVLPLPAAIPASSAFSKVTATPILPIRLAPLIIAKDRADSTTPAETRGDVLIVMAGTAGVGESPQPVDQTAATPLTSSQLSLRTALGYAEKDIVLLINTSASTNCAFDQIGTIPGTYAGTVPLTGTFHRDNSAYDADTFVRQMGRDGANPPEFKLYGVGANSTLVSYDLLQPTPADAQISDGIVEMRALYGLDTNGDGKLDSWVDATGAFADTALTDGSTTAQANLRQIVAVRIGLILRTALQEKAKATDSKAVINVEGFDSSSAASRTIFSDPDVSAFTRTRPAETGYRFRTVESIIPLRNVLLAQ